MLKIDALSFDVGGVCPNISMNHGGDIVLNWTPAVRNAVQAAAQRAQLPTPPNNLIAAMQTNLMCRIDLPNISAEITALLQNDAIGIPGGEQPADVQSTVPMLVGIHSSQALWTPE